jgi:N-acetylglucosaminyldiphosphoundecaprenol N-acetyl-beta-D-mannosaminyltransferase
MYKNTQVLGYNVYSGELSDLDYNKKHLINTFSPNSYGISLTDKEFSTALKNTDILVLDGMGIAVGSILLHGKNIKKIAGQDCFDHFVSKANKNNWRVFFLGSSESTLQKIIKRLATEFPNVKACGYAPPFKTVFNEEESRLMVNHINSFNPDILFIGMTAPKQEKWAYQYKDLVDARIITTIGNVFDWYAGNSKRPAKIWIKLRLEWFIRIFHRPEILKRNTKNQMLFFRDLLLFFFKIKKIP